MSNFTDHSSCGHSLQHDCRILRTISLSNQEQKQDRDGKTVVASVLLQCCGRYCRYGSVFSVIYDHTAIAARGGNGTHRNRYVTAASRIADRYLNHCCGA
ncbi:hypothetical protein RIF29_15799 [Crotalaria pallida]|uniref:Uncharacterized protein n=1 Tax=Crotalaria pallida TaxID=3830 RepID=A0AAN9ICX3_CROPI